MIVARPCRDWWYCANDSLASFLGGSRQIAFGRKRNPLTFRRSTDKDNEDNKDKDKLNKVAQRQLHSLTHKPCCQIIKCWILNKNSKEMEQKNHRLTGIPGQIPSSSQYSWLTNWFTSCTRLLAKSLACVVSSTSGVSPSLFRIVSSSPFSLTLSPISSATTPRKEMSSTPLQMIEWL